MLEVGGRADKQKLTSRESANSFLVRRRKEFANEAAEKIEREKQEEANRKVRAKHIAKRKARRNARETSTNCSENNMWAVRHNLSKACGFLRKIDEFKQR